MQTLVKNQISFICKERGLIRQVRGWNRTRGLKKSQTLVYQSNLAEQPTQKYLAWVKSLEVKKTKIANQDKNQEMPKVQNNVTCI